MSEEQGIKLEVIEYLNSTGWWTIRVNGGYLGGVWMYYWKMPENWTDYVSFEDVAECYGSSMTLLEIQEILENLIDANQTDGFLDILALKLGFPALIIDTKALKGKERKKQRLMVRILRRLGCISGFVRSVGECHRLIVEWTEAEAERLRQVTRSVAASSDCWITKEEYLTG